MPKAAGIVIWWIIIIIGKGGKTRKRGKNDNEEYKRELEFKEDGQGNNT